MGVDVPGANGLKKIVKESDHEARTNLKKAVVRILQFKSGSWTNTMTLPDVDVGLTWLAASGVGGWERTAVKVKRHLRRRFPPCPQQSDETITTYDWNGTWERVLATFDSKRACFMKWISPAGVGGEWARQELQLNLAVALDHWRDHVCSRIGELERARIADACAKKIRTKLSVTLCGSS